MPIKPVLYVDIDGVMADSISWWLTLYNLDANTKFTKEDVTEWDTRKCIGADLLPYFNNYDRVKPIIGSFRYVQMLANWYRIVFATAGRGSDWLRQYLTKPEIIGIQDKSLLRGFALIDDNPMNLDGFIGKQYLLSQPWNQGRGLNDTSWDEIVQDLIKENHNES